MPKVSVIIPVYNAEKHINRCIDSIIAQTFSDWELLLVDDGSPDKSGEICDEYAAKDNRIRVFHKENGGVSSARNVGLDNVKGDRIVFVDSDDWAESSYLSDFFVEELMGDEDIVLQGKKNEEDGKVIGMESLKNKSYTNIAEAIIDNNLLTFGAPYCKLYSRKLIEKYNIRFPESYSYGEDTTFFLKVMSVSARVITTSKCNYHYVDAVDGSLSKKDHDYIPLSMFLSDSMALVKDIDIKSQARNILVMEYLPNYRNLLLRAVANMYRLKYTYSERQLCFRDIKENLLVNIGSNRDFIVYLLRFIPIPMLQFIFYWVVKLRK